MTTSTDMLNYYNNSTWSETEIPKPFEYHTQGRDASKLSPKERLAFVAEVINSSDPSEERKELTNRYIQAAFALPNSSDTLSACEECLEKFPASEKENIEIEFSNGTITIPRYVEKALAKDSPFFQKALETDGRIKVDALSKEAFLQIYECWKEKTPISDVQKAYQVLSDGSAITLCPKMASKCLIEEIHLWSIEDEKTLENIEKIVENLASNASPELKKELASLLLKMYLSTEDEKIQSKCLQSIDLLEPSEINHTFVGDVFDEGLRQFIETHPQVHWNIECNEFNDEQFQSLFQMFPTLDVKSLKLSAKSKTEEEGQITDKSISLFRDRLKGVEHLTLVNCNDITDAAITNIANLENLKDLSLKNCNISSNGINIIRQTEKLTSLNLSGASLSSDDIDKLSLSSTLENIDLSLTAVTNQDIETLCDKLPLKSIDLFFCPDIGNDALEACAQCKTLEEANFASCAGITDEGVATLTQSTSLKKLSFANCDRLSDTSLSQIATMPNLQELDVSNCKITDATLNALTPQITSLSISRCDNITSNGFEALSKTHIQTLDLSYTNITDEDLQKLVENSSLTHLSLKGCNSLSENAVEILKNAKYLRKCDVSECENIPKELKLWNAQEDIDPDLYVVGLDPTKEEDAQANMNKHPQSMMKTLYFRFHDWWNRKA